jgi:hypothetical protein
MKLLKTLTRIINSKMRKADRALQVSNCIDLVDEQQYKMAEAFKKLTIAINDLNYKLEEAKGKISVEENPGVKAVLKKNVEILEATIARLSKNKKTLADKLEKSENSRAVLLAKKTLFDSISELKSTSSNAFERGEFNVDDIMAEIDKSIRDIESEFQADDELNELVK